MKLVVQRCSRAKVTADGIVTGEIAKGMVVLIGITHTDSTKISEWMCEKILSLRIFQDDDQKMNRSIVDVQGSILVVSQFTLYGDASKGTRPSYIQAARPQQAEALYDEFIALLRKKCAEHPAVNIATGVFGAMMDVELVNSGPVTILLEK